MSQITYIAYAAAAVRFLQAGHRLILVLLSVMLLVWFVVLASIRERVTSTDEPWSKVDGWTMPISTRSAETMTVLRGVSTSTAMMSLGLTLFGPLLVIWAFLP